MWRVIRKTWMILRSISPMCFICSFYKRRSKKCRKTVKSSVEKKVDQFVVLLYFGRFGLYGVCSSLMKLTPELCLSRFSLIDEQQFLSFSENSALIQHFSWTVNQLFLLLTACLFLVDPEFQLISNAITLMNNLDFPFLLFPKIILFSNHKSNVDCFFSVNNVKMRN